MMAMDYQKENEQLKQDIQELRAALKAAEQKIHELTGLLNQNSRNSNWPSSRDKSRRQKRTKSLRRKSNKKPGGQKGHQGNTLEFRTRLDHIARHRPQVCGHCQHPFAAGQVAITRQKRQVHDLPPLEILVTEHQMETLRCTCCGQESSGRFPPSVTHPVQYGPGVQQLAVYLKHEQFIPYDRSRQFFADLFGLRLSPGSLQNFTTKTAQRLQQVTQQIKAAITQAPIGHFDESGFYIGGQRHWLHTASTNTMTYYQAHRHRGQKATDAIGVLPAFRGTAIHDNWSAYWRYEQCAHGLCHVHHLRELTAVAENDQQRWATHFKAFLLSTKQAIASAKAAGLTSLPPRKVQQIERIYQQLVSMGLRANPPPATGWPRGKRGRPGKPKARNLVERFQAQQQVMLAFVYDFKVPFDNNLAERDIRMLKVQQKVSGCFRSAEGAECFCTIRSYISTMRKQGLSVWDALGSVFSGSILMPDLIPV